ncbi:MAG TPA: HAD family phosphatase [Chitinophagaceae bacterium]|nr:HAD family phosphatase [Chitinophagaceae bacterium]
MAFNTVIWDLGGVLIDWNPKYVFDENYFDSEEKRNYFFSHICTNDWNEEQDAGRSIVEATQELVQKFPDWEKAIRDFYGRWTDMLGGPIYDTVELFRELKDSEQLKHYALTNWQANLFDIALVRYDFLHWFDGRVVSGEEKTRKPFPEFYHRLLDRYKINPSDAVFIDDNLRNVKAAEGLGLKSVHFKNTVQLKEELKGYLIL